MKLALTAIASLSALLLSSPVSALPKVPYIISADGKLLGLITPNKYEQAGICNPYGSYQNRYHSLSPLNQFGNYGNENSDLSAYGENSRRPPGIFENGKLVARLTKNPTYSNRVDPDWLVWAYCQQ